MTMTLEEALAGLGAPTQNTRAMVPMDGYVARLLGLPESAVYSIRVGAVGRLRKQVQQSDRGTGAAIVVAVYRDHELVERTATVAPTILGLDRKDAIVALCVPGGTEPVSWTVFEPAGGDISARMRGYFDQVTTVHVRPTVPETQPDLSLGAFDVSVVPQGVGGPLVLDPRIKRMLRLAIASSKAVMLIGPPGTGKTSLLREAFAEAQSDPGAYGLAESPGEAPLMVTPEEGWTTRELVGGETVDDAGRLRFRPGHVLDAIERDRWLIVDEANRADMDRIFGGLLTFLSEQAVTLGRASGQPESAEVILEWGTGYESKVEGLERLVTGTGSPIRFQAGRDWRLLGTYNALDAHRVFRFGQALGRRFARVPVPAVDVGAFVQALAPYLEDMTDRAPGVDRGRVQHVLTGLYAAHLDTPPIIGPALFLAVPSYVASGLELADDDSGATFASGSQALEQLLVEGYLLGAGPLLAQLDPAALATFRARVVTDEDLIQEEQWAFLSSLLPTLT